MNERLLIVKEFDIITCNPDYKKDASAAKAGAKAVANALAKGIPVTIMRDGVLIQINPDRTETVVEALA